MQLTAADKLRTSNDQYSNRNYSQNVPVTVTNEKPFVQSELDGWNLHVHVVFEEHRSYPHNDIRYYGTTLVYRYFVRLSCLFLVWLNKRKERTTSWLSVRWIYILCMQFTCNCKMLKWQSEAIAHEDNGLKKMLTVDRPTGTK